MQKLLCIHGWSDSGEAFDAMIHQVLQGGHHQRYHVCLADFISLDDAVTFTDLVEAMQAAWLAHQLPLSGKSVSVITHSTGALVLRAWLRRYYPHGGSPISHALLLAPPNFGSYLAHKGRAFCGRILKGLGNPKPFEVGEKLLLDLELASPFLWELAQFDILGPHTSFHPHDILTTVAIGDSGYDGLASAANIPGSDGVVSLASAPLMAQCMTVRDDQGKPLISMKKSTSKVAFVIIPGVNHASILGAPHPTAAVIDYCVAALRVQPHEFDRYCARLSIHNAWYRQQYPALGLQQTITKVTNQYHHAVEDYCIAFAESLPHASGQHLHADMVLSVHTHSQAPAYRAFTMDVQQLQRLPLPATQPIDIGVTGMPLLSMPEVVVGYAPYSLSLSLSTLQKQWVSGGVMLIDWQIPRQYRHALFQFDEPAEICTV